MTRRRAAGRRTTSRAPALVAATLPVLAGCGEDTDSSDELDPTPTEPTTEPTEQTAQELAEASLTTYLAQLEDARRSGDAADLNGLNKVATGTAFANARRTVTDYARLDIRLQGEIAHDWDEPYKVSDATVSIRDCEDRSASKVVMTESGSVVAMQGPKGEKVGPTNIVEYAVTLEGDAWLVESADVRWDEPC